MNEAGTNYTDINRFLLQPAHVSARTRCSSARTVRST